MFKRHSITTDYDFRTLVSKLKSFKGWVAFDTETTGLHLKKDVPFLITLTFDGNSYAIPLSCFHRHQYQQLFDAMQSAEFVIGHNIKFDLHMLKNVGIEYKYDNLSDSMIFTRLALDTDEVLTLALKSLSKKFLNEDAGEDEKQIKMHLTRLRAARTRELMNLVRESGKTKTWFRDVLKDTIFETSDFGDFADVYTKFLEENQEPTYEDVFKVEPQLMMSYAMNDTELTLRLAMLMYPSLIGKGQLEVFKRENALILPLFEMERVGLKIDREYLENSRKRLREYIKRLRDKLISVAGTEVTVGQHKYIKDLFLTRFGIAVKSSDSATLTNVLETAEQSDAKEFAETILTLRTLEKWYSVYVMNLLNNSEYDGRAYTQINQARAVTGRVSSDFQQFPSKAIMDGDVEIFHPRKAVIVTGNGYDKTYYLDYSQIELRVQADYTYQISGGDLNMCRAYMPFRCHTQDGHKFDPKEDKDLIYKEVWFQDEDNEVWHPVDLHSMTTRKAFPDIDPDSDDFKHYRKLGKSTNFAKNYGATTNTLMKQFGYDKETAEALNKGYYEAFPEVLKYQNLVTRVYKRRGFVKNRYGRRYYLSNSRFAYKLYNYLIQGTCADMLKEKIVEVYKLLKPYRTRFQMNIHDELSFEVWNGEEHLIPVIKQIMEDVDWSIIPVVSDVEYSETNWAEKTKAEV